MKFAKITSAVLAAAMAAQLLGGCSDNEVKLDPANPTVVSVWHYYNGAQKEAFDALIDEFNATVGTEVGIIVQGTSYSDVGALEDAVTSAAEEGADKLPSIFAAYSDMAYAVEEKGMLAELDSYFTNEELSEYVDGFIAEGRFSKDGKLMIFPVAKSTEVFILNKTDWDKFAEATGADIAELETREGLVRVSERYYEWTDSLTPDIPDDGKAFYGRDAMANLFTAGLMQLGTEIFAADNGNVTINADKENLRKIWDCYYVPYINGWFSSYGRFRSDDVKIGQICALTGSSASATYFPKQVMTDEASYPIEALTLPVPEFEGGKHYAVQQGAGMAVAKSTPSCEYASVEFLKWFTESERNLKFACLSGYMPVKKAANEEELLTMAVKDMDAADTIPVEALNVCFDIASKNEMYTYKAFSGAGAARNVLNYSLSDKAAADCEKVNQMVAEGMSRAEAAASFDTDENFEEWYNGFCAALNEACGK
ncbi:MAG: extracellular solute-binding protein [Oscillospiraceae bacterium]|nr:extracellular solute-binding protein [Oscillospiraceae bacterium]